MEKIENSLMGSSIVIILSHLLVFVGNQGKGLFCSICRFIGILFQFPTSNTDLLLMCFGVEGIICLLGLLLFINKIIRNN